MASMATISLALCLLTLPVLAQSPPPNFDAVEARLVTLAKSPGGLTVTFQPAEWPNAHWTAEAGKAWDWSKTAALALDVTNPETTPVTFSIRVDDDPMADGSKHCRTAGATVGAGKTERFVFDLGGDDPMEHGMRGGPPAPAQTGLTPMSGGGGVKTSHVVAWQIFMHQPETPRTLVIKNARLLPTDASSSDRYTAIVDKFGQFAKADWPGKIHGVQQFAARRADEEKSLAASPVLPGRDEYGGWLAGPKLPASGFFATAKRDGRWWLVTPSGHSFLSLGVNAIDLWHATITQTREAMFTDLPSSTDPLARHFSTAGHILYGPVKDPSVKTFDFYKANLERKYGPNFETAWRETALKRLQNWGFNTVANWSDEGLAAARKVPYTATLGISGNHARVSSGSDYWGKMHDPFDPQFALDCEAAFRDKATKTKTDPWCIGYFVDNELSWGGGGGPDGGRYGLAYGALNSQSDAPAKREFLAELKRKYQTIEKLNTAWGTSLANWDALAAPYKASETPNAALTADLSAFVSAFATQYFTVVNAALKKFDPNHLYLGCRFAWKTPEAVAAAGKVCDVVSFNIYNARVNKAEWTRETASFDKPCLIGEFHFGALDRGLFHPGLVSTPNQAARAAMYEDYIRSVADLPNFVGCHWFQYADEPLTGRPLDGENYNIGFVSVTDTPYPEMVAAARAAHGAMYQRHAAAK